MKIKRLDLYIFTEVLKPFLGTSILFFFLFFMFQTFRLSDYLIVHHVGLGVVLKISFYLLLSFSPFVFPVSFLTSVLIGFGRLSSESELVAFKAAGVSLRRMAIPAFILAIGVFFLAAALALEWAPWGERSLTADLVKMGNTKVATQLKEKTFNSGFYDLLLYADEIDSNSGAMRKVFIYDETQKGFPLVVVAEEGSVHSVLSKNTFGGQILLQLYRGKTFRLDKESNSTQVMGFDQYRIYRKIEESDATDTNRPRMISYKVLLNAIKTAPVHSQYHNDVSTEFWKRISTSMAPLVFCFLGIGLGTVRTRAVQSRGVLLTFVTILVYWETLVYATVVSSAGIHPAAFVMQWPNLVLLVPSAFFFKRASW